MIPTDPLAQSFFPPVKDEPEEPPRVGRKMKVAPPGLFGQHQAQPAAEAPAPRPAAQAPAEPTPGRPASPAHQQAAQAFTSGGQMGQAEGLASYHQAMADTNNAISREMDSRRDQAMQWDKMAHEKDLASMQHQADMARTQASMQAHAQDMQAKNARNSALMQAAGVGGTTIVNGQRVDGFSPFRQALLG